MLSQGNASAELRRSDLAENSTRGAIEKSGETCRIRRSKGHRSFGEPNNPGFTNEKTTTPKNQIEWPINGAIATYLMKSFGTAVNAKVSGQKAAIHFLVR